MSEEEYREFKDNKSSAEDNKSSGWILVVIGIAGLIFTALSFFGIIPLHIGNSYLFHGVLLAMFIVFTVMGVVSFKNAKHYEAKAATDKMLKETLLDWSRQNLNSDIIDSEISEEEKNADDDTSALYFERSRVITEKINKKFVNLDQDFLDNLVDTEIYDIIFGKEDLPEE